jgi:hypothetical protein
MSGKSSWRKEMPPLLHFLEQRGNRVRGHDEVLGYQLYFVDLSAWKLRFAANTPLLWMRLADMLGFDNAWQAGESLLEALRMRNLMERQTIILIEGLERGLRDYLHQYLLPVMVLDAADAEAVMASRRPTGELLDRLCPQLSPALLAPYEISKPVTGSRFFGRESDLRRILHGSESNYAVMGIRRIGKSSLLREVERRLQEQAAENESDEEAAQRIYYKDCVNLDSTLAFMQAMVSHFHPQELARLENRLYPLFFADFARRMAKRYGGPLVLLLDEFDNLLRTEFFGDGLLDQLRAASNEGNCRFIFAGFRELLNEASRQDSPFFNFTKPLRLKEFSREDAAFMILNPLDNLRVQLEGREEIVSSIYEQTAGQPNLIQFYCSYLVDKLDRSSRRSLSPADLTGFHADENFRAFLTNAFIDNTTHLEKAIVFSLLLAGVQGDSAFDLEAIDNALQRQDIAPQLLEIERSCRSLELGGILSKEGRHYRFAIPVFPSVLAANYNVHYLLGKIRNEGI